MVKVSEKVARKEPMRALNIAGPDVAAPSKNKIVTALRSNSLKQFTGLMYLRF